MEQKKTWYEKAQKFLRHVAESDKASMLMYGTGALLLVIVIFQAGMLVGSRKTNLLEEQSERYHNISKTLPVVHGATGRIISLDFPMLLVADQDHTEKIVLLRPETIIRSSRSSLLSNQLKPGDFVVIIGTPNPNGHILANLIRVLPQ